MSVMVQPSSKSEGNIEHSSSSRLLDSLPYPKRFYSLDVLRGFAALAVVVHHWPNLLKQNSTQPMASIYQNLPYTRILQAFYRSGWRAVDLFFCLSGFIFFWLYGSAIRERKISFVSFGVLRFSRLYPLHIVTLLFVLGAQMFFMAHTGHYFIVQGNSANRFILNFFMVDAWIPRQLNADSFNGPVWSVSVEVLMYLIFFAVCFLRRTRWFYWAALLVISLALGQQHKLPDYVIRGLTGFFVGCLTFLLFETIVRRWHSRRLIAGLVCLTILVWAAATLVPTVPGEFREGFTAEQLAHCKRMDNVLRLFYTLAVFPLTILTLALIEITRGTLGKRLAVIGDLSYSSYMLHFPLQMVFWGAFLYSGQSQQIFNSPLLLASFFVVLVPLSVLTYHYFERPAQNFLRKSILHKTKAV